MTSNPTDPQNTSARWPYWLWSVQLLPALVLTIYAGWRISVASAERLGITVSVIGLTLGVLWLAGALLMLASARGRRWIIARRKEWGLSFASVAITLALADVVLNLTGLVPSIEAQRNRSLSYSMSRFTSYRLVPQQIATPSGTLTVNSRGFRGPEVDAVKPAGRIRIAFLGGSQVLDYHGADWPALAGGLLRARGLDVETINAGVPGYNSTDALAVLLTDLWVLRPDVVFACHGWNDFKYFPRVGPGAPYRGLPPKSPSPWLLDWRTHPSGLDRLLTTSAIYRQFRWGLVKFLFREEGFSAFSAFNTEAGDLNLPPAQSWGPRQFAINLDLMATLSAQIGARLVLCRQAYLRAGPTTSGADAHKYTLHNLDFATIEEFTQAYETVRATVAEVARRHDLAIVDMDAALGQHMAHFWDAVHFTPEGSKAAARAVAEGLEATVRALQSAARP